MRKKLILLMTLASLVFGLGVGCSSEPEVVHLRFLNAFAPNSPVTPNYTERFVELVNEKGGGTLTMEIAAGPDSVPLFEQFRPLKEGLFDVSIHHPTFHADFTKLGAAQDVIFGDFGVREDCGLNDSIRKVYSEQTGTHYLGPLPLGVGWRVYTKDPVSQADFGGMKIRGTPIYAPFYDGVNATMVVVGLFDVYSSLEQGVVDGFGMGGPLAWAFKLYEQVGYEIRPHVGEVVDSVHVNQDKWDSLSDEYKQILQDALKEASDEGRQAYRDLDENETQLMVAEGLQVIDLPSAEASKLVNAWTTEVLEKYVLSDGGKYAADIRKGVECVRGKVPQL